MYQPNPNLNQKKYKQRLFVGEGNFSYTAAFMERRKELGQTGIGSAITATELSSEEQLQEEHGDTFKTRIQSLKKQDVKIVFGVDARNIDKNQDLLNGCQYQRIHFNFPCSRNKDGETDLLKAFFKSSSSLQHPGDRIHVVLPNYFEERLDKNYQIEKLNHNQIKARRAYYLGGTYNIAQASAEAGYKLIKKRSFTEHEKVRYLGYQHHITGETDSPIVAKTSREYLFEKQIKEPELTQKILEGHSIVDFEKNVLKNLTTSPDSSDYEDKPINSATILNNMGVKYFRAKNYEPAIEAFSRSISIKSTPQNLYNRGRSYYENNNLDLALIDYKKALETKPGYAKAELARNNTESRMSMK
jgi:tetratricopeptide (TPR) repeat protein